MANLINVDYNPLRRSESTRLDAQQAGKLPRSMDMLQRSADISRRYLELSEKSLERNEFYRKAQMGLNVANLMYQVGTARNNELIKNESFKAQQAAQAKLYEEILNGNVKAEFTKDADGKLRVNLSDTSFLDSIAAEYKKNLNKKLWFFGDKGGADGAIDAVIGGVKADGLNFAFKQGYADLKNLEAQNMDNAVKADIKRGVVGDYANIEAQIKTMLGDRSPAQRDALLEQSKHAVDAGIIRNKALEKLGAEGLESALAYINEDYYRTRLSDEEHDKLGQFLKGRDGELTAQTIARYQNEYNALVTPQYDEAGRITNTPLRPQEAVAELMKNGGGRASDETALRQELTKLQGQTALETAYRNYTENWDNGKALEKYLQRYSKGGDLFHQFDGADEKLLLTAQNLFKQALAAPGGGGGSASKLEKLTNEAVDSARMFVINQIQKGRFDQSILAAGKETIIGDVYTILKDTGFDVGDVEVFATKYYDRLTTDFFKIAREQLQDNRPRAYNALIGIEDFLKDSFDEKKGIDGLNNLDSADQAALKREITDLVWDITVGTNWKAITDEDYEARINNVKALVAGKNLTALREFKQDTMNSDKYIAQRMFEIENIGKDIVSTGPQGEINVLSPYRGTIEWFKNFDKKRIADYLKEEEGLTISGESLRDEFDLSRSPADGYSVDDAGNEISFDRDATRTYTLGTPDGLRKFTQKTNDTGYGLYELFEDGSEKLLRGTLTQYEGSNAQKLDALLSEERNHKDELSLIIDRAVAAKNPPPDISEDRWRYMKSGEREEYVEKFEKTNPSGFKEWIERSYQEPPRGWAGKKPWNKMSLAEKIEAVGIFNKRGERTH